MIRTYLLIISFVLLGTGVLWAQNTPAGRPAMLINQGDTLHGTLLIPKERDTPPVVLIHPGSGPTDRDGNNPMMKNNSLKMLAEALYQQGIASLRIDKRGVAQSTGAAVSESELRFENYIEDAAAWLNWLKENQDLGPVLMLGHSEGSLIGMVATQKSPTVGFISLAGAGRPADEVLKSQLSAQGPQLTAITDPIIDSLKAGKTVEEVSPMLASLFRPSVQPYLISWFAYNPQEEIQALEIPVLILQGTTDIQVAVSEAEFLKEARKDQADETRYQVIEGMNHVLKAAPEDRMANMTTYSNPDLPLVPELVESIVSFVKEVTQP